MNVKYLSSAAMTLCYVACTNESPESSFSAEPTSAQSASPVQTTQPEPQPSASSLVTPGSSQTSTIGETSATPSLSVPSVGASTPSLPSETAGEPEPQAGVPALPSRAEMLGESDGGAPGLADSAPAPDVEAEPPESSAPSTTPPANGSATMAPTPPTPDGFQLMWEDPFDTVDTTRWAAQSHSWDGNLAQFTPHNVSVENGRLQLLLTPSDDAEKPYYGVEYRSVDSLTYGKVEASMRFAKGSGVVSSLVLIYTPWPPDDWNELDIECLGNTAGEVQFNHMVNIPPADPVSEHLQFPEKIDLGFDPTASFHTYAIEWLPNSVRFLVDGVVVHEPTEEVSRLVLPQNILLTIWASDAPSWAGPINDTTAPTLAEVDWLRVYSYTAP